MKCLVVDDDPDCRMLVEHLVNKHPSLELMGTAGDAETALDILADSDVDLLLLDIDLPAQSGVDLVRSGNIIPQVVFITAHREFAVDAFEHDVTDFIVKPVDAERFEKAIDKALVNYRYRNELTGKDHVYVKVNSKLVKVSFPQILFVESYGDYVKIHLTRDVHTVYTRMNTVENALRHKGFQRIHRKYLVNLAEIHAVGDREVQLNNEVSIPVSKANRGALLEKLNTL